MKLTRYTDYSLRVLMHLGLHRDRLCSISEIARAHRISENHLTKVVHHLGKLSYVTTLRGRGGGLKLARPADAIQVGEVVRKTEDGFDLLDCPACLLSPACTLTGVLSEAVAAFLQVLDRYTVSDLIRRGGDLRALLQTSTRGASEIAPANAPDTGEIITSDAGDRADHCAATLYERD